MACCHWPWTLLWEKPHETTDCDYQEALVHCISVSFKEDTALQSQMVFTSVWFAFSFVNTDISRSISLTPWVFRMHAISVCLVSLKTVLTLLGRRQYMSSCDEDNVDCSNAGWEKARGRERGLKIIPLVIPLRSLTYLSMSLSTVNMTLKTGVWA